MDSNDFTGLRWVFASTKERCVCRRQVDKRISCNFERHVAESGSPIAMYPFLVLAQDTQQSQLLYLLLCNYLQPPTVASVLSRETIFPFQR